MTGHIYRTLIDIPTECSGPRVVLRPLGAADGAELLEAVDESRAELTPWIRAVSRIETLDDATDHGARMAADWLERHRLCHAIRDRQTGRFLGEATLHRIDWELRAFEVGFWLRTSATGQGLMTEAVGLLVGLVFDRLGGRRLVIRADAGNAASIAIATRLGFVPEGSHRRASLGPDGSIRDTVVLALTDEDRAGQTGRS